MAANGDKRPIVIKRKKVAAAGAHHGGAWKVAYADFVTAMMAFFLLMWLLGATDEKQRKGLADYFNPTVPVSSTSAGGAGILAGEEMMVEKPLSGTRPEGEKPKPDHRDKGPTLGDETASPSTPADALSGNRPGPATEASLDEDDDGFQPAEYVDLDPLEADELAAKRAEQARLEEVSRQVARAMSEAEDGSLERHFFLRITPEGLVIEIIDADDRPLFALGSAVPAPILRVLVDVLVPVLDETTNAIAVVGHTDAVPFGSADYSNWELSADRANAARRLLVQHDLPDERIVRVTGKAAVEPLVAGRAAAQNRRISITLLRESGLNPGR